MPSDIPDINKDPARDPKASDLETDGTETGDADQQDSESDDSGSTEVPASRRMRRVWQLLAIVVATAAILWGLNWYSERPLAEVRNRLENGDFERALKLVNHFLAEKPTHTGALALKGRALADVGMADEAIEIFTLVPPSDAEETYALARAQMQKLQWTYAVQLLTRVMELKPNFGAALQDKVACRMQLGQVQEALDDAKRLSQIPDWEGSGQAWIAFANHDLGNLDATVTAFQKSLEYRPDAKNLPVQPHEFLVQYARSLIEAGRNAEALELIERSKLIQETEFAYLLEGRVLLNDSNKEAAATAYTRAVEMNPLSFEARENLARIALANDDPKQAEEWVKPIAKQPGLPYSTAVVILETLQKLGIEEGVKVWTGLVEELREEDEVGKKVANLLRTEPDSFWAKIIRVHRFAKAENWEQAVQILIPLVEQQGDDPFVQDLARAIQQRSVLPSLSRIPFAETEVNVDPADSDAAAKNREPDKDASSSRK